MASKRILFVSRSELVSPLHAQFKAHECQAMVVDDRASAMKVVEARKADLVFTLPSLPGYRAQDLLDAVQQSAHPVPVIVFTEKGSAEEARYYMEMGAQDYWLCPLTWEKIQAVLPEDAPAPVAPRPVAQSTPREVSIVGTHPSVTRVLALARQVAPSKATVLISGESGTGKEMFARFIHAHSGRENAPFVAVNCAALPEHLLESELFGHEKGSFTGAISRKLGKFELASGGTLLLDEISEMALALQAKLLRALQEGEIDRVGGVETVKVDVRVLATTNRNLEQSVEKGEFRQDLFYRLNVIPLRLPSLAQRGDDVLLLADFFIRRLTREYGLGPLQLSTEARDWLMAHDWPGNVRELQNLMERAVLLAGAGPIRSVHFLLDGQEWSPEINEEGETAAPGVLPMPSATSAVTIDADGRIPTIQEMEMHLIIKSLDKTAGNRTKASELLGISVRTLRNKLGEYRKIGLDIP
ncbi:sigma-54 dependent transcriptional regulator [Desulfomicrobium sp. ZS1]|uniref:sigma-54-dependent transcriptional regulator n=1 Tax=Desulfomicrobium sp. ZS1 TaxID=2952228 RepID=UPI0020B40A46|nr:sigma-54 dependent transcriptional regulator [Desulfomicrobium sp. ZS1]UTF50116.1 sigma-54 dependent transcriptional regulator [Desulfomicrobium sp. ZS1]